MIEIVSIDTPTLGDRSYLVSDGEVAFVVDPQRDIDRMLKAAAFRGVRVTHVFETHIHNDYVTGGLALAKATGAAYHVNADDPVAFDHTPVRDGDEITISPAMRVRVMATPGHTFTHLGYVLFSDGRPPAAFTGGSLLYGATGRPDLLGPDHTHALAQAQYATAHRLATELPETTELFPTHGFGSFCSATQSEATASTLGRERRANPVLTLSEHDYIRTLLAGLDDHPAYYAHMAPANLAGPGTPDPSPPDRADAAELRRRIEAGEWVVDLRTRKAFAAGHLAGTLNFGLDGSFATYLGWLIPWGTPLNLLGDTPEQIAEAQRELIRIGIDRPATAATGNPADWSGGAALRHHRTAGFAELTAVRHHRHVTVLDVRRDQEWQASHLTDALHIPLHDLLPRLGEIPDGEIWIHCQAGYRASIAASILDAAGHQVIAVDDDYDQAVRDGMAVAA